MLLAAVGGFLDAYTYLSRGKVFANAQTGNLVLLGIRAFEGDWQTTLHYVVPVCAFVLGVVLAESIRFRRDRFMTLHWRQLVLGVEIIVLVAAAFVPEQFNDMVNAAVSFVCAMQVNSFRTFEDNPYATTMCTGNLRSGTVQLWRYFKHREKENLRSGLGYFAVILCFVSGAGIGALLTVILLAKGMNYLLQKHHSTVSHVIIGIILAATLPIIPFAGFVSSVQSGVTNALCLLFGVAAALLLDRFNRKVDVPDSAA